MKEQNIEEIFTAQTQRRRGINVGAALYGRLGQPRRVAPTLGNLRWAQPTLRYLLIMISTLTLPLMSACGGGGGGGSSPTVPSTIMTLSSATPGSNSVYMVKNSSLSSGSVLAIDIKVDSVSNVFGAAFDIDFDSTKMTYSDYSAGSFLETGGHTVTYIATQAVNKLIVGVSRQSPSGGQSGSGTLVILKFNVTGDTSVSFSNNSLKDSSNNTISATWYGGNVTVQ